MRADEHIVLLDVFAIVARPVLDHRRLLPDDARYRQKGFIVAARRGNFSRAAESLNLTVSALSHQFHALEKRLQQRLFERDPGGIRLTPDGQRLFDAAAEPFDAIERALRPRSSRRDDVLTLSLLPVMASSWLVPRLPSFFATHRNSRSTCSRAGAHSERGWSNRRASSARHWSPIRLAGGLPKRNAIARRRRHGLHASPSPADAIGDHGLSRMTIGNVPFILLSRSPGYRMPLALPTRFTRRQANGSTIAHGEIRSRQTVSD